MCINIVFLQLLIISDSYISIVNFVVPGATGLRVASSFPSVHPLNRRVATATPCIPHDQSSRNKITKKTIHGNEKQ